MRFRGGFWGEAALSFLQNRSRIFKIVSLVSLDAVVLVCVAFVAYMLRMSEIALPPHDIIIIDLAGAAAEHCLCRTIRCIFIDYASAHPWIRHVYNSFANSRCRRLVAIRFRERQGRIPAFSDRNLRNFRSNVS